MRKILFFIIVLFCIVFIIPSIFTKRRKGTYVADEKKESIETPTNQQKIEEQLKQKYEYEKYATIKLYHKKSSQIEDMPIDQYLYGVVSAEMPVSYELEALKAQAIVARTYTIYQIMHSGGKHESADICDDFACCQAWISKEDRMNRWDENEKESNWEKIVEAVDSTQGKIITYAGSPIDAFFHSNSGGTTETVSNVWGGSDFPYLQSVQTSGEEGYTGYSSEVELTKDELLKKLKEKHPETEINFEDVNSIRILEYTESNRVKTIQFGNIQIAGTEARKIFGLKSTNFSVETKDGKIKFVVTGYGHGVGMSQTGADSMAKQGNGFEEIIKHFYTGVEIVDINDMN